MAVDNFNTIKHLLEWRSSDDFYFLQILQRKKDAKDRMKVNGTNNNSRLVKAYYISSMEYFDFIKPEIIKLCELFNARAGINLNRRSYYRMHLEHQRKLLDQSLNGDYTHSHKAYSSVVGEVSNDTDKKWILDIDVAGIEGQKLMSDIGEYLSRVQPVDVLNKVIAKIPSKNGYHLITSPFNLKSFKEDYPEIEVHKNNPTNCYVP